MRPWYWLTGEETDGQDTTLNEYILPYIGILKSEYVTLITSIGAKDREDVRYKEATNQAAQVFAKADNDLRWSDIHLLERVIVRLQPLSTLRRRAWGLRDRYHSAVGDQVYAAYERSHPPDPTSDTVSEDDLRADMDQMLSGFHWMYAILPLREAARSRIIRVVARQMFLYFVVILILLLWDLVAARVGPSLPRFASLLPLVMFMGASGAFVSLLQRIESIPATGDTILNVLMIKSGRFGFLLAPLHGAFFALLLYLVFASGFITGDLFPRVRVAANANAVNAARAGEAYRVVPTLENLAIGMMPITAIDFAKLLIWSFIAGFAERLIPDALNRVISQRIEGVVDRFVPSVPPAPPPSRARDEERARKAIEQRMQAEIEGSGRNAEVEKQAAELKADADAREAADVGKAEQAAAEARSTGTEQEQAKADSRPAEVRADAAVRAAREKAEVEIGAADEKSRIEQIVARQKAEADKQEIEKAPPEEGHDAPETLTPENQPRENEPTKQEPE